MRWSFWLCEDWLEAAIRPRGAAAPAGETHAAAIDAAGDDGGAAEAAEARSTEADDIAGGGQADARGLLPGDVDRVFGAGGGDGGDLRVGAAVVPVGAGGRYVGYWNGAGDRDIGDAGGGGRGWRVLGGNAAGDATAGGFGEATMRHALRDAQRASGLEKTVLQSTQAGLKLYERMGYRKTAQFSIYLSE